MPEDGDPHNNPIKALKSRRHLGDYMPIVNLAAVALRVVLMAIRVWMDWQLLSK